MNQLKAGAALSYVSIVLSVVSGLLYTPFMLRMLGQSEYGLFSIAWSVIAYLSVLDLGLGNALMRYTAKFRAEGRLREQEEMFGMFFLLYAGIGLLTLAGGSFVALNVESLFGANMTPTEVERTQIIMWLLTFNLAITFPLSIWGGIATAYERFVFMRGLEIVRVVLNPLIMILLLFMGYKAVALAVVTTLFNVGMLLMSYWYCRHRLKLRLRFARFRWDFLREVAIFSFWIFLGIVMERIYWNTGQFVLGVYSGTAVVAVYAVAVQLTLLFMKFSTAISGVFLPKLTAMVTNGSTDREISDLFIRTGRIQFVVMSFIISAFVVFGRPFIRLWAGEGYSQVYTLLLLFFFALLIPLIQNVGISVLQARAQLKFRSICSVMTALSCLGLSIWSAKEWGLMGCAVATAGALLVGQGLVMNIYYHRRQHIDIPRFWWEILKMAAVPTLLAVIALWATDHFGFNLLRFDVFAAAVGVYALLFILLFWRFGLNASERELLDIRRRKRTA